MISLLLGHFKSSWIFYAVIAGLLAIMGVRIKYLNHKVEKVNSLLYSCRASVDQQNAAIINMKTQSDLALKKDADVMAKINADKALSYKNLKTDDKAPQGCEDAIKYGVAHSDYQH